MALRTWMHCRPSLGRDRLRRACLGVLLLAAALVFHLNSSSAAEPAPQAAPASSPEGIEYFEAHIRPLFVAHCLECHGADKQGGLQLDSRAAMLAGSDHGPSVVPGNAADSRLMSAVRWTDEPKMPPEGKLPDDAIAKLETWINLGAPAPGAGAPVPPATARTAAAQSHWAFQPVVKPAFPAVTQAAWPRSPIDYFILSKLEAANLTPSVAADRRTVFRRASFDVTGVPPENVAVEQLLADSDPQAVDRTLENLLSSPHYGERWARHWLDVARYADSKGYVFTEDRNYPNAYKYRDWVVRAFNGDLPYNEFLIQQIAADRLPLEGDKSELAAMGFLTVGRRFLNNAHDIIDDRIDVLTRGTMGLTVTCARCHDHKYDPIPTKDYYSLYGVLASSVEPKEPADVMTLADAEQPTNPRVFVRGNSGNHGDEVPRQFLSILSGEHRQPFQNGSGRLELAEAIASPTNPLTARVIANRIWMYYFEQPLVNTPSDFGLRSEPPTHPELLDYLASTLVENNWSLKSIHRLILTSATYQQSSAERPDGRQIDPENRLLWRMNRKRLDFEALRDALLAASGQLDAAIGGPAVDLFEQPWPKRRTIYGRIDRQNLPNLFRTFDFASPDTHSPQRYTTTVPQQALYMLNSPFVRDQAHHLATRPELMSDDASVRIQRLYQTALSRPPTERELELGRAFLATEESTAAGGDAKPEGAPNPNGEQTALSSWERLVQVVLLSNEFVFVD
jgi:mono/diheme cytochrome c family protein